MAISLNISSVFHQNITHKNNPIVETTGLINQNQLLMKNFYHRLPIAALILIIVWLFV